MLDGHPLSGFESQKVWALLIYLAVGADRPHGSDALASLLWPDQPDVDARNNLRQALANLRQVLGDRSAARPFLLIARDSIQFNPACDYELDVATFTALLTACESHTHRRLGHCSSCVARMERAVALYRGDFLAELDVGDSAPFEEWQLLHRERLYQRALDALAHLADYYGIAAGLEALAGVARVGSQPERAARLFGAATALREAIGAPLSPSERPAVAS
jgi:DNA-binding SARP family transcriptional activator